MLLDALEVDALFDKSLFMKLPLDWNMFTISLINDKFNLKFKVVIKNCIWNNIE
jgi:hypothetical protein